MFAQCKILLDKKDDLKVRKQAILKKAKSMYKVKEGKNRDNKNNRTEQNEAKIVNKKEHGIQDFMLVKMSHDDLYQRI